jgi:adenylosuccinate lyase
MTWEEYRKAMQATAQPSLEDRVKWLEADAAAQRTAILRLEQALKRSSLRWIIFGSVCLALALALKVLT